MSAGDGIDRNSKEIGVHGSESELLDIGPFEKRKLTPQSGPCIETSGSSESFGQTKVV